MKPIYTPKGKALEYGDYALNIYTGCNHLCTYCYARMMHDRFHPDRPFEDVRPREGLLEALRKQLATGQYADKLIHLCFTCDPYPAPPVDTSITREVIQAIKGAGAHVQILTKGGMRAERDFDLLDGGDWFGATYAGYRANPILLSAAEPNASSPFERLKSLVLAKNKGINTWVSCEPVLDAERVYRLIETGEYIDQFRIGKLNYAPSAINWAEFGRECERLAAKHGRNIYIKDDLRKAMEGV